MRRLVRRTPAELMYCLQTQTPRAICTRLAVARPLILDDGRMAGGDHMGSTCCYARRYSSFAIPSSSDIRTTSAHAPDLPDASFLPSSKTAKAVYAARPLLMIPTPISLFLLLVLTFTPTVSGLLEWPRPMAQVSRVPDPALFHVDLQEAFALILWGNRHHRRSSGSETMKDFRACSCGFDIDETLDGDIA